MAEAFQADSRGGLYRHLAGMSLPGSSAGRPPPGAGDSRFWGRPATAGHRPGRAAPGDAAPEAGFLAQCLRWDRESYLPEDILVKVDRAAMRAALETRLPYLDHELAEWACRLPASFLVRGGEGKWVLRELLKTLLPEPFWNRPKTGLTLPLAGLLRGELKAWAAERWHSPALRRLPGIGLSPAARSRIWREHQAGRRDWNYALWAILVLASWLETDWAGRAARVRSAIADGWRSGRESGQEGPRSAAWSC